MLHVTNGDSAAEVIRASGVGGEVLAWRDLLHDGPVPAGLPLPELSAVRADFIAAQGSGEVDQLRRDFEARDAALTGSSAHDEVVLWFEHDLYDQLQLVQVLDFFATAERGDTRLTLVCGPEYLGPSEPRRLADRFDDRVDVTDEQLALARASWHAFRSPDPRAVAARAMAENFELEFLRAALVRHMEQFPSTRNGLSRSEQQALEAIAAGAATVRDAYLVSHQRREDPIWLGDSTFASYLQSLAACPSPLVVLGDGAEMERSVALTDAGREVLEGREDHVRLNGIDRWLGGVHLQGHGAPWRWDVTARRLAD